MAISTPHIVHLPNEEATLAFAAQLAKATFAEGCVGPLADGSDPGCATLGGVICLSGELGAGKTTLTRGLLRGYGFSGAVKSPTYTLVEPYEFDQCHIYHFDLYRLADPEEVEYLGVEDYFQPGNLCIVEWAERGAGVIPAADLSITLHLSGTGRELHCQSHTEKGALITKRLWP